jgi:heat-inducible transcriptional repressor
MDERARFLLKLIVERYISDGEPVGSRTLSKTSGLELSPASIRNVMADLEEQGFIASPHTSAGRVPTARGYRMFVDSLIVTKPLESAAISQAKEELSAALQPQQTMSAAAKLLSDLSAFAGVVVTPKREPVFKQIEFILLGEKRILLVIVTPDGDVQNRMLITEKNYSHAQLIEVANYVNTHFAGRAIPEAREHLAQELRKLREDISSLMAATLEAGNDALQPSADTAVVLSGERRLLNTNDLTHNMDTVRRMFDLFEHRWQIAQLLDIAQRSNGVQIFIGGEAGVSPLDELSLVSAPYQVDGKVVGTLGVIGPTRMAYERVIPIVDITAKLLSSALSQQMGGASNT